MAKFKPKELGSGVIRYGVPVAALGISTANFVTNSKKRQENKDFQEKQLEVLGNLTDNLDKVNKTMKDLEDMKLQQPPQAPQPQEKKKRRPRFSLRLHSRTGDYALKGATIGGSLVGIGSLLPSKIGGTFEKGGDGKYNFKDNPAFKYPKFKEKYNGLEDSGLKTILLSLGGVAIGATLGAIVGAVIDVSEAVTRKSTVNARLMKGVIEDLHKSGYKEGSEFTRDPKAASLMKTKVCLVISRSADSLRLLINTVNDPKLKKLSEGIIRNLPSMSTVTEKASDRFNELNVTTMTTNNGDATWVASVADRFIASGYPVYLVEVG